MEQETKTFTEEEVSKKVQSETDKVRTEYSSKIKGLEDELNKYKPKQPTEKEKQLQDRIKEFEEKERLFSLKEKTIKVQDQLNTLGLPKELGKYINVGDDVETSLKELSDILKDYKSNNGYIPRGHKETTGITKEQFSKMSYKDRLNLFKTNTELYNQLSR